jgi:hypothetical protein
MKGRFPRRLQYRELVSIRACAFLAEPDSGQGQPSTELPVQATEASLQFFQAGRIPYDNLDEQIRTEEQ